MEIVDGNCVRLVVVTPSLLWITERDKRSNEQTKAEVSRNLSQQKPETGKFHICVNLNHKSSQGFDSTELLVRMKVACSLLWRFDDGVRAEMQPAWLNHDSQQDHTHAD